MDHFLIRVPHELHRDILRHACFHQHADIFVSKLMGAYLRHPIRLMVGILLAVAGSGIGARDRAGLTVLAPKTCPVAVIPGCCHRLLPQADDVGFRGHFAVWFQRILEQPQQRNLTDARRRLGSSNMRLIGDPLHRLGDMDDIMFKIDILQLDSAALSARRSPVQR